jgi:hypothetical protein
LRAAVLNNGRIGVALLAVLFSPLRTIRSIAHEGNCKHNKGLRSVPCSRFSLVVISAHIASASSSLDGEKYIPPNLAADGITSDDIALAKAAGT